MIIRIGVGDTLPKQHGYINVDIRPLDNIDVVADAMKLPFRKGEHDSIESRNLVEHFSRYEIDDLFKEWARVLKKKGTMVIQTIDMGELMDYWREIPEDNLLDAILGAQTYPENFHKMAFTKDILEKKLKKAGMKIIKTHQFVERLIPRIQVIAEKL